MEKCEHGAIEWCPKCEEDLRKDAEEELTTLRQRWEKALPILRALADGECNYDEVMMTYHGNWQEQAQQLLEENNERNLAGND